MSNDLEDDRVFVELAAKAAGIDVNGAMRAD